MVRVAAKLWQAATRAGTASVCPSAAVAASATGSAPLRATSARTRRSRVCSTKALKYGWLVCLRRGTFHRGKVPKTRRGLRPPVPLRGPAACISGRGIAQAVTLHQAVPFHTPYPFPASRDPVESDGRCGYRSFLKGRTDFPGTGVGCCTRQSLRVKFPSSP